MKLEKKTKSSKQISTSSMPDIIFMLLIFFMVTTVMREFEGLTVEVPSAKMIEKLESKRHTSYVWANKAGLINIDDQIVSTTSLSNALWSKIQNDPKVTISLKSDIDASMKLITDIHTAMRKAQTLKLSYSALTEVQ